MKKTSDFVADNENDDDDVSDDGEIDMRVKYVNMIAERFHRFIANEDHKLKNMIISSHQFVTTLQTFKK